MNSVKRVVLIHIGIIVGLTIITVIVSRITGVGTENTWLGDIYVNALFVIIFKMLWNIRTIKRKNLLVNVILIFCLSMLALGIIMLNVIIIGIHVFGEGWYNQ